MARRTRKKATKKNVITVDFEGVESGGQVPEGDYRVRVKEVEQGTSESSGAAKLTWKFEVVEGKSKGKIIYHTTSLQPQSLWTLRGILEALGMDVPSSTYDIDTDELLDMECGVSVVMREYNDKDYARISEFYDADEVKDGEEEDDEEDDEEEDESDEEDDADEEEDDDEDEEGDEEEDDEEEDDEEEEGEEEYISAEDVMSAKIGELRQIVKDYEIKIDLRKFDTIKKKRDAVLKALTKAGYID